METNDINGSLKDPRLNDFKQFSGQEYLQFNEDDRLGLQKLLESSYEEMVVCCQPSKRMIDHDDQ